jgi:hypothetical protein
MTNKKDELANKIPNPKRESRPSKHDDDTYSKMEKVAKAHRTKPANERVTDTGHTVGAVRKNTGPNRSKNYSFDAMVWNQIYGKDSILRNIVRGADGKQRRV